MQMLRLAPAKPTSRQICITFRPARRTGGRNSCAAALGSEGLPQVADLHNSIADVAGAAIGQSGGQSGPSVQSVVETVGSSTPLSIGATLLAVVGAVYLLNVVRSTLSASYDACIESQGSASLLASTLGILLNIIGSDFSSTASAKGAKGRTADAPQLATAAAGSTGGGSGLEPAAETGNSAVSGAISEGKSALADIEANKSAVSASAGTSSSNGASANNAASSSNGAGPDDTLVMQARDMQETVATEEGGHVIACALARRTEKVHSHFKQALAVDDFLARVEVSLAAYGFRGDSSLALTCVCRDESTGILKAKIDEIYGQAFNINGLGISAGLSHAPVDSHGKERYVFFAFPHIAVDETGEPAAIFRPGREGKSSACGALMYATSAVQGGLEEDSPGVHDPSNPEGSILMNRLKRQIRADGRDPKEVDIVEMTQIANRVITRDLESLISQAVNTDKANYAVVTGVQIHSWPSPESDEPILEYVEPATAYVNVNGVKHELDLQAMPALTPRQIAILAANSGRDSQVPDAAAYLRTTTVMGVDQPDPAAARPMFGVGDHGEPGRHEVPEWVQPYSRTCC